MANSTGESSGSEETVAMATQPASSSSGSGAHDEGRFVAGSLLGGRYRILNLLGKGGMGEVYRATDLTLGQSVALKFLPVAAAANPHLLERFHGEVRVARQVSHPNVCRVYDIGEAEGFPYISMEYVDGDDLASLSQRIGRLPSEKALEISRKLCAGLAAAHSRGVIHRDLKPQNIMLNKRGEVLIMDFGLAAIADQLSGAEARNGTPAYMSPEQLKGVEVTAKSDIYCLGLILHELFTGKKPFEAKSIAELIEAQESTTLAEITALVGEIDPGVERVVRACLHPDAARRPASALAVAAALPGGDPLAAALAAGETPSPDMVAAAGVTEGLSKKWAVASLLVVVLSLVVAPLGKQKLLAVNYAQLELTPEVLAQRARELAGSFGYPQAPKDSFLQMERRPSWVSYLSGRPGPKQWSLWFDAEPPLGAWYRQSPEWLLAGPQGIGIGPENPTANRPGRVEVLLDAKGRMRRFEGIPGLASGKEPVGKGAVFGAAGLDLNGFQEIATTRQPLTLFDEYRAYKGKHPQMPDVDLEVEIASYRGQITHAEVFGPWSNQDSRGGSALPEWTQLRDLVMFLALAALSIYAFLLARRNWRLERADRRGALKVAIARFAVGIGYWAAVVHAVPDMEMLDYFATACSFSLLNAAAIWVLYLALEPALRAKWPHSMVSWNRLLRGKWNDSLVASHILIGCAAGCALWGVFSLRQVLTIDSAGVTSGGFGLMAYGTRSAFGAVFSRAIECLSFGLLGFFCLFGFRMLMRKDWLAAAMGAVLFPLIESGVSGGVSGWSVYGLYVVVYGVLLMIMLRLGVVATMSTMMFLNLIGASPMGTNLTTWYAPNGLAVSALILVVAGWSFYKALGNQDLLGDSAHGTGA